MKRLFPTYLVLCGALVLAGLTFAACGGGANETNLNVNAAPATTSPTASASPAAGMSGDMGGMGNMKSSPNAASAPYDLQFLDTMTAHHQGAIDMAKPAQTKAQHAELKEFARKIVEDQQREIAQMKGWRDQWYAGKPEAMNMEMPGMMDSMKGMDMKGVEAAAGNAFDLMFIDMMTPHHRGAVEMAREALTRAEHPEIKKLARQIIDAQEKEIAQMDKWKSAWGGAKTDSAKTDGEKTGDAKAGDANKTVTVNSHNPGARHDASTGHKPGDMHPPKP
ncbi:MAG TPA: DUF305 domain-containing protein [Pyrinomonadaceae bacterium]|nr:DUF305 domain-containing protein [Pyrinomonadaceae bacterium]